MSNLNKDYPSAPEIVNRTWDDFDKAKQNKVSADSISIWGGRFADRDDRFQSFIGHWVDCKSRFKWAMWEAVSRFDLLTVDDGTELRPPETGDFDHVERVRLFGETADLMVRRDREELYWRFIAEPDTIWPESAMIEFGLADFGEENPDHEFFKVERRFLLWNKYLNDDKETHSEEERVSTDWRNSEVINLGDDALYLRQLHYIRAGRVEFVRFVDIGGK